MSNLNNIIDLKSIISSAAITIQSGKCCFFLLFEIEIILLNISNLIK